MAARIASARLYRAEEGFGLVEVLVSALLLVIVALGMFASFDGSTRASGINRDRTVAANLARTDQERLRGLSPAQITSLAPTTTQDVNGKTFTIASTATWVADRTGTPSCTSADGRADYLKIRSSVTWPDMRATPAVVSESLRSIPRGAFRPNEGSVSIKVLDRNGAGVPGATVTSSDLTGGPWTTNSLGCVLIDQVAVGSYGFTVAKSGSVNDAFPNAGSVSDTLKVAKEQTSTLTTTLDVAGTARVSFRTTSAVCNSTTPQASCTEASTTGEGFTAAHSGLVDPTSIAFTLPSATAANANLYSGAVVTGGSTALTTSTTKAMFPFSSDYAVWSGACDDADPRKWTPLPTGTTPGLANALTVQTVPPGGMASTTLNYYVREPRMEIKVLRYSDTSQTGTKVTAVTGQKVTLVPENTACARTVSATTSSSGIAAFAMPYGRYKVCAQDSTSTTSARRRTGVSRTNATANGTSYSAVYNSGATEPDNGAIILPYNASSSPGAAC